MHVGTVDHGSSDVVKFESLEAIGRGGLPSPTGVRKRTFAPIDSLSVALFVQLAPPAAFLDAKD